MRVAIFTDTYLPEVNGVAKTLGRWVDYLKRQQVECKVFAPSPQWGDGNLYHEQQIIVERFHSFPFLLYPECRLGIPNPIQLKKSLKELQPDIIHVATPFNMGLYGQRYAKKHGIPLVASYHTHFDKYLSYYKIPWMEQIFWKYMHWFHQDCEKVYVPSQSTMDHIAPRGFKKMEIWGRGIDTEKFQPEVDRKAVLSKHGLDHHKYTILFVGRIAPEKGIDVLLSSFHSLPTRIKDHAQLTIVGDGPLYSELKEKYKDHKSITLLGFVKGQPLMDLYAAADVFLFPSATETFGNVVLESMASGTPVIGANAGGVKDNVQHGVTGLLCEPDRSDEFTKALIHLHDHEKHRISLSKQARAYSKKQSWDVIFENLHHSYENVISQKAAVIV
ncbi:glycosyltransferase family 4 protein [Longirhabdus pacifica]|uniref:glycosyltransferase family 4 protein n=1 Tax=Longirhabdus pacifica TaxID=2305227 RepID=UPI0010086CFC